MPQNQMERRRRGERRSGNDRRSWKCQLDFPYVDSHGTLVSADRRRIVERRIEYAEYINGDRRSGILNQFSN
ncbi:MAG TPA: hypothetical protein ENK04_07115 [Gammaproteobacteria bacterium]|nr:hypothetical protein [Gammaproteobacteria bacterium]